VDENCGTIHLVALLDVSRDQDDAWKHALIHSQCSPQAGLSLHEEYATATQTLKAVQQEL